jgi:hypothetical protein
VTRLSREYMTRELFPVFLDMRRVRSRIYAALDRPVWPRDATELYLMLGCLSGSWPRPLTISGIRRQLRN